MKKGFTDITIVLDRSFSMDGVRTETIGGFNTFIQGQRAQPGECVVSLVQFDDQYESLYTAVPVRIAPLLTTGTFVPRGWTALWDAIGRTINGTGGRLASMPEDQRPEKVIFVILTDGDNNASHEFTREKVFDMIGHQRTAYLWDFVFLGANQDAMKTGASLNISAGSTMSYAANSVGTREAFTSASIYTSSNRSVGGAAAGASAFTAEDRERQIKAGLNQSQNAKSI